jgi:hypothetical protein
MVRASADSRRWPDRARRIAEPSKLLRFAKITILVHSEATPLTRLPDVPNRHAHQSSI